MIYELARAVEADLRAREFPVRVIYGNERVTRTSFAEHVIVIDRDRKGGEAFGPPLGAQRNPKRFAVRLCGVQATLFAGSTLPGARQNDHERVMDPLVDAFYCAVHEWMRVHAKVPEFQANEARYATAADFNDLETWPGAAYIFRWRAPRVVEKRTYQREALPTGIVAASTGEVRIRRNDDDPPEVLELP